ncbi:hypothetical protein CRUP_027544 [Coryphaenoides rupestris]|nr:hypothetical protein CRUP_027544 [Coryphaenoides rupestris]
MQDTYFGTMYTSDDRGILYTKSLERHLFGGHRKSDFTNITSLRGVYLTNKLEEGTPTHPTPSTAGIRTVISFNRGGPLAADGESQENVDCGDVQNCNLHIHGEHSRYSHIVPMLPPLRAVAGALEGPHHYRILDSGGLIVAVEAQHEAQVQTIKYSVPSIPQRQQFSTDEGQCWKAYNFTEHPLFFAGLTSEPGTKAMNVSVWGYRPEDDEQPMWVAVTIDFKSILTRQCNDRDYEDWLAHSTEGGDPETNGCVLGSRETYRRLKKTSVCRNGRNYSVRKKQSPCPCTREDFLCDYGYLRRNDTSECVRQPNTADPNPEVCLNGMEDEQIQTFGVPSDRCEGGFAPQRTSETIARPCGGKPSEALSPREKMVLSLVTPTYRFSNLRVQDEDADTTTTTDPEGGACGNGTPFHNDHDSDDVMFSKI